MVRLNQRTAMECSAVTWQRSVECVPVCAYVCGVCECGGVCCQEVIVMVKSRGRYLLPRLLAATGW